MKKIELSVEDLHVETVLNILENLKEGLIVNIQTDAKPKRSPRYQPKTNTIIREENSGTSDTSGKYMNASAYKQRLKK